MKKAAIVIVLLSALTIGTIGKGEECIDEPCDPNSIDFVYDPNSVVFDLIGSKQVIVNEEIIWPLLVCDPDGDEVVVQCLNAPAGLSVVLEDGIYKMYWQPDMKGIYYLDFIATDEPEYGQALSDWGTLIIKVYAENRPPVFRCGG